MPGIDGRPGVAHQHLARTGHGRLDLDDAEVVGADLARGIGDEVDLAAHQRRGTGGSQ